MNNIFTSKRKKKTFDIEQNFSNMYGSLWMIWNFYHKNNNDVDS